jgi:hypothetical protein
VNFEFNTMTTVTVGYGTPISGGSDREFDGEFRMMINRRFGAQSPLTRAEF